MSRYILYGIGMIMVLMMMAIHPLAAQERFTDNGDGTVTDHQLNLMWSKTDNQGDMSWNEAIKWIKYTFAITTKYDDWRLPTLAELESLYVADENYEGYESDCGQKVRIVNVIRLTCGWIWTSEKQAITARVFNFSRGYHYTDRTVHKRAYRVLPVRTIDAKGSSEKK